MARTLTDDDLTAMVEVMNEHVCRFRDFQPADFSDAKEIVSAWRSAKAGTLSFVGKLILVLLFAIVILAVNHGMGWMFWKVGK